MKRVITVSQNEMGFKHMPIGELHSKLADDHYVVVDIRDAASFQASHIPHSTNLSNDTLTDFLHSADFDKPVVVCCYHGISSQQAAQFLVSQDFTDVYSLDGGFTQWQATYPAEVEAS